MAGIDFKLGADDDIDITNSTMQLTSTIEELTKQRIDITLQTYKGEWVFDILQGIPWLSNKNNPLQLLSKDGQAFIDFEVFQAISDKDEIIQIDKFETSFNPNSRGTSIEFSARTNTGEITSTVTL